VDVVEEPEGAAEMTPAQLRTLFPACKDPEAFAGALTEAMQRFAINRHERQAAFLAQIGHESAQLTRTSENLNYSAEGLLRTFPRYFIGLEQANKYAHKPEAIANRVYANRMHNGDEQSGDGWKYRGAGLIQLTGKENHLAASLYFEKDLDAIGDWLRAPEGACLSAAWFWECAGGNEAADQGDFDKVSDLINIGRKTDKVGDAIGYEDRLALFKKAEKVLA
jgi:putative chitinase